MLCICTYDVFYSCSAFTEHHRIIDTVCRRIYIRVPSLSPIISASIAYIYIHYHNEWWSALIKFSVSITKMFCSNWVRKTILDNISLATYNILVCCEFFLAYMRTRKWNLFVWFRIYIASYIITRFYPYILEQFNSTILVWSNSRLALTAATVIIYNHIFFVFMSWMIGVSEGSFHSDALPYVMMIW